MHSRGQKGMLNDKCKTPSVLHTGDPTGQTHSWCPWFYEQGKPGYLIKVTKRYAQPPHKMFIWKGKKKEKGSPLSSGHAVVLSGAMHRNILSQQSLLYQPQEYILIMYSGKKYFHSFWIHSFTLHGVIQGWILHLFCLNCSHICPQLTEMLEKLHSVNSKLDPWPTRRETSEYVEHLCKSCERFSRCILKKVFLFLPSQFICTLFHA